MFVPLIDANPLRYVKFQFVTIALMAANAFVFIVFQSGLVLPGGEAFTLALGVIPAVIVDAAELPPGLVLVPEDVTLVTYMFLHGDWLHLATNMLFLWVFGDNVEDALGHLRYLAFYILCGILAGLCHIVVAPDSEAPLVGASGAIAGVLAGYLMLHPRVRLWVLFLGRIPLRIPAWVVLGAWIVTQIASALIPSDMGGEMGPTIEVQVAWFAHIGGFVSGAILVLFMRRPGVQLFDRGLPGPTSPLAPPTRR